MFQTLCLFFCSCLVLQHLWMLNFYIRLVESPKVNKNLSYDAEIDFEGTDKNCSKTSRKRQHFCMETSRKLMALKLKKIIQY
jgi:hypothetical protein